MATSSNILKSFGILIKSRVEAIFIWSWLTAITCLVVGRGFPPLTPTLKTIFAMVFMSMSMYLFNDVIDAEMDSYNEMKSKRPIPSGKVSKEDTMKLVYIAGVLGLGLLLSVNLYSFLFGALYVMTLIGYSHPSIRFKKRFLLNETFYFTCFLYAGLMASYAVAGAPSLPGLFAAIIFGAFITTLKPLFGDSTDMEEDRQFGMRHLGVVLSWKAKIQMMILVVLFIMTITPLTYVRLGFNVILPIFIVAASLLYLRMMFPIMNNYDKVIVMRAKKFTHVYFFLLQILILVSSLNINLPF